MTGYSCIASDLRHRRVSNKQVLLAAAFATALYAALVLGAWWKDAFSPHDIGAARADWNFLWACAVSAGTGFGLAVLLWVAKLWPAGDAKLFVILTALLPLAAPARLAPTPRLPLEFLVNIFIPAAVGVLAGSVVWLWRVKLRDGFAFHLDLGRSRVAGYWYDRAAEAWREMRDDLSGRLRRAKEDPGAAARETASVGAVWIFGALVLAHVAQTMPWYHYLGPVLGVLIIGAWRWLGARFSRETIWGALAVAIAASVTLGGGSFLGLFWMSLLQWTFFGLLFQTGMFVLRRIIRGREGLSATLAMITFMGSLGLAPILFPFLFTGVIETAAWWSLLGIVLGAVYALMRAALEEDVTYCPAEWIHSRLVLASSAWEEIGKDKEFLEENFRWRYPDGLTEKQAASLREWCQRRSVSAVAVRKTEPFVVWMFAGMAVSLALGTDVVNYVLRLAR